MKAVELLETLRLEMEEALFDAYWKSLTNEQKNSFAFIRQRLQDGEKAEEALLKIECIIGEENGKS